MVNQDKTKIKKQYDLFTINDNTNDNFREEEQENKVQKVMLDIKRKYGKNAILKGMNLQEGGTTIERNKLILNNENGIFYFTKK